MELIIEEQPTQETECVELKNIKYKTLIKNGIPLTETKSSSDLTTLDKYLENEKNNNKQEPWCKLNKTIKTKKLQEFVDIYKSENSLTEEECKLLLVFFNDCLDRKKLQKVKDVIYNKETGVIKDIPGLTYQKANKHFTLKNMDKRVSTLKSLAPNKTMHGTTIRKSNVTTQNDSEEDDN
jgi:hypothetical protein